MLRNHIAMNITVHYGRSAEDVKRVFRKGANLWMKDTCIDIVEKEGETGVL